MQISGGVRLLLKVASEVTFTVTVFAICTLHELDASTLKVVAVVKLPVGEVDS